MVGGVKVNMWFESTIRMVTGCRGQISIQPKLFITYNNKTRIMDTELREILNKVYKQEMRPDEAQWKICVLFNVSVSLPEYELNFCEKCYQMTNHLNGICQKCNGNER